jgi:hypothetical protein
MNTIIFLGVGLVMGLIMLGVWFWHKSKNIGVGNRNVGYRQDNYVADKNTYDQRNQNEDLVWKQMGALYQGKKSNGNKGDDQYDSGF